MKYLPKFFLVVDFGFIIYWLITAFHLINEAYLYNDYTNPILVAWNWSFFPLDMAISGSGLFSLYLRGKKKELWRFWAMISLVMTSVSGLMAISYWAITRDFQLQWWLPNLFLLIYPMYFIFRLGQTKKWPEANKNSRIRYLGIPKKLRNRSLIYFGTPSER